VAEFDWNLLRLKVELVGIDRPDRLLVEGAAGEQGQLADRHPSGHRGHAAHATAGQLRAAAKSLHAGAEMRVGPNDWYMAPDGSATAVIIVRHGIVKAVGVATKMVTQGRTAQRRFITSFS
jgi:hypothetical protein